MHFRSFKAHRLDADPDLSSGGSRVFLLQIHLPFRSDRRQTGHSAVLIMKDKFITGIKQLNMQHRSSVFLCSAYLERKRRELILLSCKSLRQKIVVRIQYDRSVPVLPVFFHYNRGCGVRHGEGNIIGIYKDCDQQIQQGHHYKEKRNPYLSADSRKPETADSMPCRNCCLLRPAEYSGPEPHQHPQEKIHHSPDKCLKIQRLIVCVNGRKNKIIGPPVLTAHEQFRLIIGCFTQAQ